MGRGIRGAGVGGRGSGGAGEGGGGAGEGGRTRSLGDRACCAGGTSTPFIALISKLQSPVCLWLISKPR